MKYVFELFEYSCVSFHKQCLKKSADGPADTQRQTARPPARPSAHLHMALPHDIKIGIKECFVSFWSLVYGQSTRQERLNWCLAIARIKGNDSPRSKALRSFGFHPSPRWFSHSCSLPTWPPPGNEKSVEVFLASTSLRNSSRLAWVAAHHHHCNHRRHPASYPSSHAALVVDRFNVCATGKTMLLDLELCCALWQQKTKHASMTFKETHESQKPAYHKI